MHRRFAVPLVLFATAACPALAATDADAVIHEQARSIRQAAGLRAGLIVHLGCGDGRLTAALGTDSNCLVHGLDRDAQLVQRARQRFASQGLGRNVTADRIDGKRLPYIDNLVNLIVVTTDLGPTPLGELARVLAPGGVAMMRGADATGHDSALESLPCRLDGWTALVKPWPEDMDQWTHWLHGPDNNAVSRDRRVGISRHLQWIMPPRWARHHNLLPSVSAMVWAGGRLYYIIDEGAIGVRGLPDRWHLVARDAFNGLLLWKRPIANWGWHRWSAVEVAGLMRFKVPGQLYRRLVAVDDVVYVTLGFDQPVVALDGATGKALRQYSGTENASEILVRDGRLYLARNTDGDAPGKAFLAVDADDGRILWEKGGFRGTTAHGDELQKYTDAYLTLGDDRLFFIDGDDVVALDRDSGQQAWRAPRPEMEKNVFGHYLFNHANLCSLVYHDGILFLAQMLPFPDNLNARQQKSLILRAMDARSGRTLWEYPGMTLAHFTPPDLFVNGGLVWTLKRKDVSLLGLDVRTGEVSKEYPVKDLLVGHHHRCYRNKATERFYLGGEEGIEYIDFRTGQLDIHHWVRGVCSYGILPAGGCIYLPTHSCGCHNNAKLNGFLALTSTPVPAAAEAPEPQLETGAVDAASLQPAPAAPEDWPTFKHDNLRSNHAPTAVPERLVRQWSRALGPRLTAPVIADGKLLVAGSDRPRLYCLDAQTGQSRWDVTTEGALDTPPTYHRGRLLFGTRAGFVYALRAEDGQRLWRFRAAPADYRLTAFGRLESVWPVSGSVLAIGDRLWCVAGRSMHLNSGLYVYMLDLDTGKILQQAHLEADTSTKGEVQGAVLPDILLSDGRSISMRTLRFSAEDLSQREIDKSGRLLTANDGGLLDDTWFNSAFWVYLKNRAQMLVFDQDTVYGIQAYQKFVTKSYPHDVFTPGTGYRLFAADKAAGPAPGAGQSKRDKRKKKTSAPPAKWQQHVGQRARGMVVSDQHLFLAGIPDVVPKEDPWAAFENRRGGTLAVYAKQDGAALAEYHLDAPPVYDGMAAARGRLYLSLEDGTVACYGPAAR